MAEPTATSSKDRNWPKDEFGRGEVISQLWPIPITIIALLSAALLPLISGFKSRGQVVAYCAQDQVYAEPIFREFEKASGINVQAVFDNEAVKTVGLVNRLLAEKNHPQCDVFWGNEELRTRQLAAKQVIQQNKWAAFGYRSRRVVINTNQLSVAAGPHSLLELTNAQWRAHLALAYPQFGTTATHFCALRQHWGDELWLAWCKGLAANKPMLVDGNSVVVKMVGNGSAWIGLTDSDDIADGQREGLPLAALPMNEETLLIPNTVAITRDAPDPKPAERLFEYLQRPEVIKQLVAANALEGFSTTEVKVGTLNVNWDALLRDLESTTAKLNEIFLR